MRVLKCLISALLIAMVFARPNARTNKIRKKIHNDDLVIVWVDEDDTGAYSDSTADENTEAENFGSKCGYSSCNVPQSDKLNVHIVPHTHDDVGWLKTVDQYYYGSKTLIQKAGVQYIIDSVIQELIKDPNKKFIYVESAFFFQWWKEQTGELKEQVKVLVNEGRLEFIGGAWSMNDEATTHYQSIIDQFAWGLKRLNDTFGECGRPKIGWQIDPFGHARESASMFAHMGFDGLFFGRLDYQDKEHRLETKTPEMIWRASPNQGRSSDLFTGALYNQYQPPPGFCFDILCADEPIIDDPHSPDYNVDRRVEAFFDYVKNMSTGYRTNNVLITMGEDFHYQDAHMWYKNLDKLIKYANQKQLNGSDVNLFYSTPSCYLKALHDANISWPTKDDDFFPYASDPNAYWTGYFTSRPTLKRFERVGNHFLQVCKQLTALAANKENHFEPHLAFLRETMGIMQHHDAVTGTEKQKVADDYAKRLEVAMRACGANTRAILNNFVTGEPNKQVQGHDEKVEYKFEFKSCMDLNISKCAMTEENNNFVVTLYNPLAHSTFQYIRFPVSGNKYEVKDYKGQPVPSQIVPVPLPVKGLHYRSSNASQELVFLANELPPMGYKSFYVSLIPDNKETADIVPEVKMIMDDPTSFAEDTVIGNKYINLTFGSNGLLASVSTNGITRKITQDFIYYEGANGDNREFKNRSSGAYIFRPNSTQRIISTQAKIEVVRGSLVDEVHQIFNDWISQVIRVYKDENFAEFEWLVGAIPVDDNIGKEIVTRFNSDILSNGIFYTDSNGREMIKRKRDHRDTWEVHLAEKVAGNYYPLTTKIALEDEEARMAILVDRAQGGSSLEDGSLEIMVHRRLLHDDAFGVDEALDEQAFGKGLIARGIHYLIVGPTNSPSPTTQALERFVQVKTLLPGWTFFSNATKYPFADWQNDYNHIYSGLSLSLPQNIHLMTLEPWNDDQLLIRFEHLLEKNEDPEYSKPVTFNLKDILRELPMIELRETTLDGNQWLSDSKRLKFEEDPAGTVYESVYKDGDGKRSFHQKMIQSAKKPMVSTEYIPLDDDTEPITRERRDLKIISEARSYSENKLDEDQLTLKDDDGDAFEITVNPMQIRTFVLTLEQKI